VIVLDTETTGLIKSKSLPIDQQPHIIEFAAVKLDDQLELRGGLSFKCNPGIPLDKIITEITGLKDEDLKNEPPFSAHFPKLADFFLGEREMVAHNCSYDRDMIYLELTRVAAVTKFPWPPVHICTVEATAHLEGHRLKMTELYARAMGRPLAQKHRALDDVLALVDIVRWCRAEKLI
jgi:DNA polymerase III epsilon subunit-like protein